MGIMEVFQVWWKRIAENIEFYRNESTLCSRFRRYCFHNYVS